MPSRINTLASVLAALASEAASIASGDRKLLDSGAAAFHGKREAA